MYSHFRLGDDHRFAAEGFQVVLRKDLVGVSENLPFPLKILNLVCENMTILSKYPVVLFEGFLLVRKMCALILKTVDLLQFGLIFATELFVIIYQTMFLVQKGLVLSFELVFLV